MRKVVEDNIYKIYLDNYDIGLHTSTIMNRLTGEFPLTPLKYVKLLPQDVKPIIEIYAYLTYIPETTILIDLLYKLESLLELDLLALRINPDIHLRYFINIKSPQKKNLNMKLKNINPYNFTSLISDVSCFNNKAKISITINAINSNIFLYLFRQEGMRVVPIHLNLKNSTLLLYTLEENKPNCKALQCLNSNIKLKYKSLDKSLSCHVKEKERLSNLNQPTVNNYIIDINNMFHSEIYYKALEKSKEKELSL